MPGGPRPEPLVQNAAAMSLQAELLLLDPVGMPHSEPLRGMLRHVAVPDYQSTTNTLCNNQL